MFLSMILDLSQFSITGISYNNRPYQQTSYPYKKIEVVQTFKIFDWNTDKLHGRYEIALQSIMFLSLTIKALKNK